MRFDPSPLLLAAAGILVVLAVLAMVATRRLDAAGWRRLGIALLLVGVGLRPNVGSVPVAGAAVPVDVVIMVDRTTSMGAHDWNGDQPRTAGITADIPELMGILAGAQLKVVTFDSVVRDELPFLTDTDAIGTILATTGYEESSYSHGSSISLAVPVVEQILAESKAQAPGRTRYVVYIGDGEQTIAEAPGSFEPLRPYLDGALVLGYGSEQGGPMYAGPYSDEFMSDPATGEPYLSRIDQDNLRQIAAELGGQYLHRTEPGPIDFRIELGSAEPSKTSRHTGGLEVYWVPGIGIGLLVLWELWALVPGIVRMRKGLS